MSHWLRPLLSPETIAIVGASERKGSLAAMTHQQLVSTGYSGEIFSINPKYQQLHCAPCYASLHDLPIIPELVVYVISGLALEKSFDQALELGVGGIVIYASNYIENDSNPKLPERLKLKAAKAGVPVCGGNSMGFYNYDDQVLVSFDSPPPNRPKGNIALILHSGSGMTYLANNDARFCFNYVIASAQETCATVGDYMDYLLEQASTRVIAIFLEAVRDVPAFIAALEKASRKDIPVVITKLGRTEKSARLAASHSGAIVGDHDAFVAACKRHNAIVSNDADEMIITAMLFGAGLRATHGKLASMLDSGGMREQMIDLADDHAVNFAQISNHTTSVLERNLEAGLEAVNPMDGMGALKGDIKETYLACGKALLEDSDTGLLSLEFEFRDGFSHYPELFEVTRELVNHSDKPIVLINSCTYTSLSQTAAELIHQGIPVINGIDVALRSMKNLLGYRRLENRPINHSAAQFDSSLVDDWNNRLQQLESCDEVTSLALMSDFGLPVVAHRVADSLEQAIEIADALAYPVVMKTAEAGITHKSDQGGVKIGLKNMEELSINYEELKSSFGNQVVVMPLVDSGVEVAIGMKNDPGYGPMVIVASGGIMIELLNDRVISLAPVDNQEANAMIDRLKLAKLLAGIRGQMAVDRDALVDLIVNFSTLVYEFRDSISEVDLNPVIVNQTGCNIVDALVIPN